MNFALIDDDRVFSEELQKSICDFCKDENIAFTSDIYNTIYSDNFAESLLKYDVILLDIEMPGTNGISLGEEISRMKDTSDTPYIIFVTARDNLVFDALKVSPYSFVRKNHLEDLKRLIISLHQKLSYSPYYSVKSGWNMHYIKIEKIIYLEKQGNYILYHTTDGIVQGRGTMNEKYSDLYRYGFLRPGSGSLVNAAFVADLSSKSIKLIDGTEIFISRTYSKKLKADYNHWRAKINSSAH